MVYLRLLGDDIPVRLSNIHLLSRLGNYNYASKTLKDVYKKYKNYIPNARKQRRHSIDNFSIEKQDIVVNDKYISMKCVNKKYPAIIDEPPD